MTPKKKSSANLQALRKVALRLPDTEEGIACEGTAAERRTVKAQGKAFLFLGIADAMLKLRESLPSAKELAGEQPNRFRVGANGWVKATFIDGEAPLRLLEKWIDESYRLAVTPAKTDSKPSPKKTTVTKRTSGAKKTTVAKKTAVRRSAGKA